MDKRITFLIIFFIILVIGGITLGIFMYNQEKKAGIPKIEIAESEFDAGNVPIGAGLVKHTYKINNKGYGNLEINNIKTSCMCTQAILKTSQEVSPEFGMHNNDNSWQGVIKPDEEVELEVIFDPAFHGPDATGEIVRLVTFNTNDQDKNKIEIKLIANVTK